MPRSERGAGCLSVVRLSDDPLLPGRRGAGDLRVDPGGRSRDRPVRRDVRLARAGQKTLAVRGRVLGRGVLVLLLSLPPLVAVVCVLSLAWSAQDRGNWQLALIILAACAAGALALAPFLEIPLGWLDRSYERGSHVHELWVQHHGREDLLVRTPDALRFGQIYRAVQRAVEQQGDLR